MTRVKKTASVTTAPDHKGAPHPVRFGDKAAYSIDDVAYLLSVSKSTIRRMMDELALRSFTEGRCRLISHNAIVAYLAAKEAL